MIHRELEKDNYYQRIQKILYNIEKFNYSKVNYINSWLTSKPFFFADGEFDSQEENMFHVLKKLVN